MAKFINIDGTVEPVTREKFDEIRRGVANANAMLAPAPDTFAELDAKLEELESQGHEAWTEFDPEFVNNGGDANYDAVRYRDYMVMRQIGGPRGQWSDLGQFVMVKGFWGGPGCLPITERLWRDIVKRSNTFDAGLVRLLHESRPRSE